MSLIAAVLIFGIIILIHEFGHFLFAKLNGIGVIEFSLGMGPRLCSFEKGGTRYSIKILPFGGSCMMLGKMRTIQTSLRLTINRCGPGFRWWPRGRCSISCWL